MISEILKTEQKHNSKGKRFLYVPDLNFVSSLWSKGISKIRRGSHLFCGPSDQTNDIFPLKINHLVRWAIRQYILPLKTDRLVRWTTEQL